MTYVIAEPCIGVKDRSCVDVCPVDCIYEGDDQLYIEPDECIAAGRACPSARSWRRVVYVVEPREGGRWAVQRRGSERAATIEAPISWLGRSTDG